MSDLGFGTGLAADIPLWVCARGQPATDQVAQPPEVSGVVPSRGFRCGPQATDWGTCPLGHFGSGAQAAGPLIRACTHPEFQLWTPSPLICVHASRASGEHLHHLST